MLVPAAAQIREICTRPSRANDTGLQTPGRRSRTYLRLSASPALRAGC